MPGRPTAERTVEPRVAWLIAAFAVGVAGPLMLVGEVRAGRWAEGALSLPLLLVPVCGALVVNQQPANRLGWILLASGAAQVVGKLAENGRLLAFGRQPPSVLASWLPDVCWPFTFPLTLAFGVLLFPDGLASRRWRPAGWIGGVGCAAIAFASFTIRWGDPAHGGLRNPVDFVPSPVGRLAGTVGELLVLVAGAAGVSSSIVRYRAGQPRTRSQLRLLLGFAGTAVASVTALRLADMAVTVPGVVDQLVGALVVVGFPVAVALAVVRHRLFEWDVIVNRSAVSTLTGVATFGIVAAAVIGTERALVPRTDSLTTLAGCAAVAGGLSVALLPLRAAVRRRLFGHARNPWGVLSAFGHRAGPDAESGPVAAELAELAKTTLRLPYARVELAEGTIFDTGVRPRLPMERISLSSRGHDLGALFVSSRSASDAFTDHERELLSQLCAQAASAIRLAQVAADARDAQQQQAGIVHMERQRLRRDLHDEVGPRLAGVAYLLQAVTPAAGPAAAALEQARHELQDAIAGVRRIAHGLRPVSLEEHGLVGAVRRHAARLSASSPVDITVDAEGDGALPDEVEVAFYRVALEALNNVARHSGANACHVRLVARQGQASIEVVDNGCGITQGAPPGVGLDSIRQRAHDLGGTCEVAPGSLAGTRIRVTAPLSI